MQRLLIHSFMMAELGKSALRNTVCPDLQVAQNGRFCILDLKMNLSGPFTLLNYR